MSAERWAMRWESNDYPVEATVLCEAHAGQPEVLNRVLDATLITHDWQKISRTFDLLHERWADLPCVECLASGVAQPDTTALPVFPSPTSPETGQPVTEKPGMEELFAPRVAYLTGGEHPVQLIDAQSFDAEGLDPEWPEEAGEIVTLKLGVTETVWYPATASIPKAAYEEMCRLFPLRDEKDLPLGLVLTMIGHAGGRIVVNERHGDVQGQEPIGPVSLLEEGEARWR
jgi:hypothetical protein